jgi:hypothetical protein
MRVLDLLDVWLRREAHRSDSLLLIRPVLEVLTDMHHNGEKLVADRLTRVCLQRWGSVGVACPRDVDVREAHRALRLVTQRVALLRRTSPAQLPSALAGMAVLLLRALSGSEAISLPLPPAVDARVLGRLLLRKARPGEPIGKDESALDSADDPDVSERR